MPNNSTMVRKWINQPSTLQPLHAYHGTNVLCAPSTETTVTAYLTAGPVISMVVPTICLSPGWRP